MPGCRFGVPALDRSLGEIPHGSLVLLRRDPMVEALPFLLQAAASHLAGGQDVVYLVCNRSPSRTREALQEIDRRADLRRLHFVDAHSALIGSADQAAYAVRDPTDLAQVVDALEQAGRDWPGAVLVLDSLSGLQDHADEPGFLAALPRAFAAARRFALCIAAWTARPYSADVEQAIGGADALVNLRGVEERVVLHQTLAVDRSSWSPAAAPVLYKIDRPGGVLVYVPKVVVLGPAGAGKTTFVHSVAGAALSVERMGTTVAIDRGTAELEDVMVEVFGTPGQMRFDPLLPALADEAVGAIVVDATAPETFPRAKEMLQKVWSRGLRAVVALNKSDLPGALSPDQARRRLTLPRGRAGRVHGHPTRIGKGGPATPRGRRAAGRPWCGMSGNGAAHEGRLSTGVKRLDALLDGGIPAGSAVLVYGPPFLGKKTLARRFVLANLAAGVPGVFVLTNASSADTRKDLAASEPKYPGFEARHLVRFVDTYSRGIGATDNFPDAEYLDGALDLNGVSLAVNKQQAGLITRHDAHSLVIDSVSTLVAYSNAQTAFRFLQTLIGRTRRVGATGLYLMDQGMHSDADVQMFKHLMTGTIELRESSGKPQVQVQGLGVSATPGWVDYRFDDTLFEVTGSFAAGRIR